MSCIFTSVATSGVFWWNQDLLANSLNSAHRKECDINKTKPSWTVFTELSNVLIWSCFTVWCLHLTQKTFVAPAGSWASSWLLGSGRTCSDLPQSSLKTAANATKQVNNRDNAQVNMWTFAHVCVLEDTRRLFRHFKDGRGRSCSFVCLQKKSQRCPEKLLSETVVSKHSWSPASSDHQALLSSV